MKNKHLAVFALLLIMVCSISPLAVYAEEEEEEEDEERPGFGIQEREREGEHQDSSPFSGAILYVTIGAIIAAVGYTIIKIVRSRREIKKLQ